MLHMVVATHGPETCSHASERFRLLAVEGAARVGQVTKARGCTVHGAWANRVSHTLYMLIDAPSAHVVEQVLFDLRFPEWNTSIIDPVVSMQDAVAKKQGL